MTALTYIVAGVINKAVFTVRDLVKHEAFDKILIADPNLC
jgi:hypothetical protein